MWANVQRDGRPAEHRWRPLFNAAKFGSMYGCIFRQPHERPVRAAVYVRLCVSALKLGARFVSMHVPWTRVSFFDTRIHWPSTLHFGNFGNLSQMFSFVR